MEVFNLILIALLILFLAILNFTYLSLRYIKEGLRNIKKKTWIFLLLIFLAGFFLRLFVTAHMHNLYYDEDGYMDIAKHIADSGNNCLCLKNVEGVCEICGYSFKSVGFSFLLALIFKAFGASHSGAFNFVAVIGSLTILTMFFLLYLLFDDEKTALLGALIIAFYPLHARWSGSASSEIVSLFFITLTFSCLLLYRKVNKIILLVLSLLLFAYTMMVKEENILLMTFLGMFFLAKKRYRKIFLCVLFITLIILVPYLFGNYLFHTDVSDQNSLSRYTFWKQGKILSFEFFKKDFPANMSFLVNWDYTMHVVLLLNFVGMLYMLKNKRALGIILLVWLLTIVALFSSYIGMPLIQSEVRHYIQVLVVIVAFSSYGAASLSKHKILKKFKIEILIVAAILASTFLYLHYLDSNESPVLSAQSDHDLVEKSLSLLPKDCVVITQESYLFDFFGQSAVSIYVQSPEKLDQKCYYYYEGEVCWREEANNLCKEFRKKIVVSEPLISDGKHSLYRLSQLVD